MTLKKRITACAIAVPVLFAGVAFADRSPVEIINAEKKVLDLGGKAFIENGRTMAPLDELCDEIHWGASYDEEGVFDIYSGRYDLRITVGETAFTRYDYATDDLYNFESDVAPYMENDDVIVPVRAICEAFDIEVTWNGELGRVELGVDEDEWRILNEMFSEEDTLEGLNLNDDSYDGFEDEEFAGEGYDDLAENTETEVAK